MPAHHYVGGDPQVCYRAMDFLLAADKAVQRAVFTAAANLLNLEVDLLFFDYHVDILRNRARRR